MTYRAMVAWPPQILSYFNAGHHLALYQVGGYIERVQPEATVDVRDYSTQRCTWKEVADYLHQHTPDVVALMNDFDGVAGLERMIEYVREFSPNSKIITFGRLSSLKPTVFEALDLDAIVTSGDYEAGVAAYVRHLTEEKAMPRTGIPGVALRQDSGFAFPISPGSTLDPAEWVLVDPAMVPYDDYDFFYSNDGNKFCGIPQRRELVVPVARGCPIGCDYCEVPEVFGLKERRLSVESTLQYITTSFSNHPFEYVSFYAPTFTLNRNWVTELCHKLIEQKSPYPWKCATTVHHVSRDLIDLMARSGCVRVSVGVETLDQRGLTELPVAKRKMNEEIRSLALWCEEAGIELNCFVIVGLPGTDSESAQATATVLYELGCRVRPTMYSPHHEITQPMTMAEVGLYNRQLLPKSFARGQSAERRQAYEVLFGSAQRLTKVQERIAVVENTV